MEHRFFSIIIPLYNKEAFVERCINSVLAQTYSHFEVIVVDDGSADNGAAIVKSINDPRIRLISQANAGVSVARNVGVENAKFDFVAFIDADDTWEKEFLEEIWKLTSEYPKAGIYGTNIIYSYMDRNDWSIDFSDLFAGTQRGLIKDYFGLFAKLGRSPVTNQGCCYPKKVFNEVKGYKPGVKLIEDSDLWCRIALKYPVAFSIIPLATYYAETVNNTRSTIEYNEFQVTSTLKAFLLDKTISKDIRTSIKKLIAFQQLSLVRRALLNGYKLFAMKMLFKKQLVLHYPQYIFSYPFLAMFPDNWIVFINRTIKNVLTSR